MMDKKKANTTTSDRHKEKEKLMKNLLEKHKEPYITFLIDRIKEKQG